MKFCEGVTAKPCAWGDLASPASPASDRPYFARSNTGKYVHFSTGEKWGMLEMSLDEQLLSDEELKEIFNALVVLEGGVV